MNGPPVAAANSTYSKQTITIPASRLNTGELWYVTIQRGGTGEMYADDVILVAVALTYNASH